MTFDPKCEVLAEQFLSGVEESWARRDWAHQELAQVIQDQIEEWILCKRQDCEEAARDAAADRKLDELRDEGRF